MTTILGLDISSFQLNGCFLIGELPPQLHAASLGRARESIDRLDKIGPAMRAIAKRYQGPDVAELVIEDAYGFSRKNDKLLWAVIGGCITQGRDIWPRARITVLRTLDWRRGFDPSAKDDKPTGHRLVREALSVRWPGRAFILDEHELDAIGVAMGYKLTLAHQ